MYGMPTECSLAASSHVAVVSGVGCDPSSSTSSSLSLSHRNLHCRRRVHHQRRRQCRPLPPLPAASRGTGMACPAPPTSRRCCSHRLHILPRALTSLALVANNDAMPTILSCSSTSDESAPPRTEEIVPLPSLPRPPSSPFALISTPPGMLPLKPCGVNDSTRVHP